MRFKAVHRSRPVTRKGAGRHAAPGSPADRVRCLFGLPEGAGRRLFGGREKRGHGSAHGVLGCSLGSDREGCRTRDLGGLLGSDACLAGCEGMDCERQEVSRENSEASTCARQFVGCVRSVVWVDTSQWPVGGDDRIGGSCILGNAVESGLSSDMATPSANSVLFRRRTGGFYGRARGSTRHGNEVKC